MDASGPQRVQEGLESAYPMRPHPVIHGLASGADSEKEARTTVSHGFTPHYFHTNNSTEHLESKLPTSNNRIGGLRPRFFWLTIILIAVVVIAASVGGALAGTQSHKSTDSSSTPSTLPQDNAPVSSSAASATATPSDSSSISSTTTILSVLPTATGTTDCPTSNGTIYVAPNLSGQTITRAYEFQKLCGYDIDPSYVNTTNSVFVASFDACAMACSNMNLWAGARVCSMVSYDTAGTMPSNCWLANGTQAVEVGGNMSVAIIVSTT